MSSAGKLRFILAGATMLCCVGLATPVWAQWSQQPPAVTNMAVPPAPTPGMVDQAAGVLGNPINNPVTGAAIAPLVVGGQPPPSLETLQAARPGFTPGKGLTGPRAMALQQAALSYGARGGLAARSFAINEMLRGYQAQLDQVFNFSGLVLSVNGGQTMMRPPVVTEAQLAFALGAGGQSASESGKIYEITREAQLTSAPPNWRTYLVRTWVTPTPPPDDLRPRTRQEVQYWNLWVAQGWADGEKQAVEIFLSDLSRLQRDIIGMARYRVLLRAGLVEQPRVAFARSTVKGGRDLMKINNTTVRITDQPGLNPNPRRWRAGMGSLNGPIGATP
jgi:defect in organelle trafficking protein DotC